MSLQQQLAPHHHTLYCTQQPYDKVYNLYGKYHVILTYLAIIVSIMFVDSDSYRIITILSTINSRMSIVTISRRYWDMKPV